MKHLHTGDKFFIIIDFNASKRYSHHWTYIKNYTNILSGAGYEYEIWIPENSDYEVINNLGKNVKLILKSNLYGYSRKESLYHWSREKIINFMLDWVHYKSNNDRLENFKEFIAKFYLSHAYRRVKELSMSHTNLHLLFPTSDSLSLRLSRLCLNHSNSIKAISFRAIGVNFKDNLAIESAELYFKNLLTDFPLCEIRIGFETFAYKSKLLEFGIPSDKICWAPTPSFNRLQRNQNEIKPLILGFLGSARPNKGFEEIPRLLQVLSNLDLSFQAIIQKAVFPWPEYNLTLEKLTKLKANIRFIPENISQGELEELIAKVSVLVMPYRVNDYIIAGSGLLFIASDYSVPVLATKGVAFEWDILTYSLGSVYDSEKEFIDKLTEISNSKKIFNFSRYNYDRNIAVKKFCLIK